MFFLQILPQKMYLSKLRDVKITNHFQNQFVDIRNTPERDQWQKKDKLSITPYYNYKQWPIILGINDEYLVVLTTQLFIEVIS